MYRKYTSIYPKCTHPLETHDKHTYNTTKFYHNIFLKTKIRSKHLFHTPSKHQRNKRTHSLNTLSIRTTCTPQRIENNKETRNHRENTQPLHIPPQNVELKKQAFTFTPCNHQLIIQDGCTHKLKTKLR